MAAATLRSSPRPHERLDRTSPVVFSFNGGTVAGLAGDTIASALLAAGIRQIGHGRRLGRSRGILTADRFDPNCVVDVDGVANVAGAHHLIEEGMRVRSSLAWPARMLDPRQLDGRLRARSNPEMALRSRSGPLADSMRRLVAKRRARSFTPGLAPGRARHRHTDVLVVGGGAAGLGAAAGAASAGANVILVEADRQFGGWASLDAGGATSVAELETEARRLGVELVADAVALCATSDGAVLVAAGEELLVVHAAHVVGAFGVHERTLTFTGNDLPGVMTATAGRRLVERWAVLPGRRALVLASNDHGLQFAESLSGLGLDVREVIDTRTGGRVERAEGGSELEHVVLGDGRRVEVDTMLVAPGWTVDGVLVCSLGGSVDLATHNGAVTVAGRSGQFSVTGALVQLGQLDDVVALARVTGRQAAVAAVRHRSAGVRPTRAAPPAPRLTPVPTDEVPEVLSVGVVDFAEDLTQFDLGAEQTGLSGLLTAAAAPSSGPLARAELADLARTRAGAVELGLPLLTGAAGGTTALPCGLGLGELAALHHRVVFETALRAEHEALGGVLDDVDGWYRPLDYGDSVAERTAATSAVIVHDTGFAALLQLRGPDAHRVIVELGGSVDPTGSCVTARVIGASEPVTVIRTDDTCWWLRSASGDAAPVEAAVSTLVHLDHRNWDVHVHPIGQSLVGIALVGPRALDLCDLVLGLRPEPGRIVLGEPGAANLCAVHLPAGPQRTAANVDLVQPTVIEVRVNAGSAVGLWRTLLAEGDALGVRPAGVRAVNDLVVARGVLADA